MRRGEYMRRDPAVYPRHDDLDPTTEKVPLIPVPSTWSSRDPRRGWIGYFIRS